jgi:uncharacterized protein (TIGR03086 family)
MTGTTPFPRRWGGVELLERAIAYTRGSLASVTPGLAHVPTPCREWDLHELLVHMDDSLASLAEAGEWRRVAVRGVSAGADQHRSVLGLVAGLRERACTLLAAWSADAVVGLGRGGVMVGGRRLPEPVLVSTGALEVTVHGWDVATACGDRRPIPEPLALELLDLAPLLITDEDRPARFAAARPVGRGVSASDRLLAFVGRAT